jgi:hypothetical protein
MIGKDLHGQSIGGGMTKKQEEEEEEEYHYYHYNHHHHHNQFLPHDNPQLNRADAKEPTSSQQQYKKNHLGLHHGLQQEDKQPVYVTGSFANCTSPPPPSTIPPGSMTIADVDYASSTMRIVNVPSSSHMDFIGTVIVYCQTISFRAPSSSFLALKDKQMEQHGGQKETVH